MDATAGQKDAVKYLNCTLRNNHAPVRVGGHSKGGNFAVFAAGFCSPKIRDQIFIVYSNDGPGFKPSTAKSPEMREVRKKTVKYSPEYSAIGVILTNVVRAHLVQSDMKGVDQHNAFSWQVQGTHFVEADERDPGSILFDRTMNSWINGESEENRKLFINTLFGMFTDAGVNTLSEVTNNKVQSTRIVWNALRSMPKKSRNKFLQIFLHLEQSRRKAQAENLVVASQPLAEKLGIAAQPLVEKMAAANQPLAEKVAAASQPLAEKVAAASQPLAEKVNAMMRSIFHIEDPQETGEDW